jgi:HK97 family phage prohead protease
MREIIAEAKDRMTKSQFVAPLEGLEGKRARFVITSDAIDRQGEIVDVDGWDFKAYMQNPVILDSHRYGSIADIVGRATGEPRRQGNGWTVDVEFAETPMGDLARRLVEQGMLKAVSVGFRSLQRRPEKGLTRHIKTELLEVSLVSVPANPEALRVRSALPFADLELAGEELAWDSSEAERRVRAWASSDGSGEPGAIDWSKYRRAFMAVRDGEEELLTGYRLGFADVIDGELRAIPRAIFAVAAVLAGGRGGVELEPAERRGVLENVARYYRKLDRELPASLRDELSRSYGMDEEIDEMSADTKPKGLKNESLMELRDHLVQAVAILETMLEDYEPEEQEMGDEQEMGANEAEDSAKEAEMVAVARALLARLGG